MHARLSTVCNYEITLDPLYASIIIAFYAGARETTTNFSVARVQPRKLRSPFFSHPQRRRAHICPMADKLSSLFVASLNAFFPFQLFLATFLSSFFSFSFSLFLSVFPPEFNEIFSFSLCVNFHRVSPSGIRRYPGRVFEKLLQFYVRVTRNFLYNLVAPTANRSITFARWWRNSFEIAVC